MTISEKLIKIAENTKRLAENSDGFWDTYQQNGTRTDYQLAFAGAGWTKEIFRPKYDMKPTQMFEMFRNTSLEIDLVEHLESLGITLDTSSTTSGSSMFYSSAFTRVGIIDISKVSIATYVFHNSQKLKTIDKFILAADGNQSVSNCFGNCYALEEIRIQGMIAGSGMDFKACKKLSKASVESIISCLSDTASGQNLVLSAEAVAAAFTDAEWTALKATKPNWEIKLN